MDTESGAVPEKVSLSYEHTTDVPFLDVCISYMNVFTQSILPRLVLSFGVNGTLGANDALRDHFIFAPRMPHGLYMRLLALSDVFLNPFPFGSGITSADAIAVCVPVVTYPAGVAVMQLTLGQLAMLPKDLSDRFVVTSVEEYVARAVTLANLDTAARLDLHEAICAVKYRLFGDQVKNTVSGEWAAFIAFLARSP
jgi:hypothetical protein